MSIWVISTNGIILDRYGWFKEEKKCQEYCNTLNGKFGNKNVLFKSLKVNENKWNKLD